MFLYFEDSYYQRFYVHDLLSCVSYIQLDELLIIMFLIFLILSPVILANILAELK